MCGRFYQDLKPGDIADMGVQASKDIRFQNYNIAPSFSIPIIRYENRQNILDTSVWGLLPPWAKKKDMKPMINARAETADSKPFFRSAFKQRRCLIPASGFYEWKRNKASKTPYAISLPTRKPMAFAGLYESDDEGISCSILTTEANRQMQDVHNRMPVILSPVNYDRWLADGDKDLLTPYKGELLIWPISKKVNHPINNSPDLLKEMTD